MRWLKPLGMAKLRTFAPAAGFFGGFGWDAATLGRSITALDLFLLLGYWLGAAVLLLWLARVDRTGRGNPRVAPTGSDLGESRWQAIRFWLSDDFPYILMQFLFGGIFSALVIFYFKSAGGLPAFLMVLGLCGLMVGNEFLEDKYRGFTLPWLLFGLCGMLFLNFALPHLFGSVHPFWFFTSTILAVAATWGLRRMSPGAPGRFWPVPVTGFLLMALFLAKAIPPVPLVLKGLAMGRELEKSLEGYSVKIEQPPFWLPFRRSEKQVRNYGGPVYCVSSVFLPRGIDVRLYHRWEWRGESAEKWQTLTRAGFSVKGGRRGGFRGYTYKKNLPVGRWRVSVESEDGRTLGSTSFESVAVDSGFVIPEWKTVTLP